MNSMRELMSEIEASRIYMVMLSFSILEMSMIENRFKIVEFLEPRNLKPSIQQVIRTNQVTFSARIIPEIKLP
jgi:hypothetical protein